jgi:hypothetical protein
VSGRYLREADCSCRRRAVLFGAAGSDIRRSAPKPSREGARPPRALASLRGKDQASPAKNTSASTISGIAGVGEKPAGAITAWASAGRFKDRFSEFHAIGEMRNRAVSARSAAVFMLSFHFSSGSYERPARSQVPRARAQGRRI